MSNSIMWKNFLLGDVTFESKTRAGNLTETHLQVYGVDRHLGLVSEAKYASKNLERYKLITPGMFVYNPMRLNIGSIGYCSQNHNSGFVSPDYVVFGCNQNKLSPDFLFYLIQTPIWKQWTATAGTGSVRVRIYYKELMRMPIALPPIEEQRSIVCILKTIDNKIELNRRMNKTLETMVCAIFNSWFVDFDPVRAKAEGREPDGMDGETAVLFPDSFEETELGMVPRGWRIGHLGDIAENSRCGIHPFQIPLTTPYIGLEHMPCKSIALSEWKYSDGLESNKFRFDRGNILFGKLRPYFHKVGIAPTNGVCSTDILVIVPKQKHWFAFLLGHISSDSFVDYTNSTSTGTKMPRTNWQDMSCYDVVIPSEPVARMFNLQIMPMIEMILSNISQLRTLSIIRNTLLPKLLSGEIRATDMKSSEICS
jgi:type I restriction enzyme, S subunit